MKVKYSYIRTQKEFKVMLQILTKIEYDHWDNIEERKRLGLHVLLYTFLFCVHVHAMVYLCV